MTHTFRERLDGLSDSFVDSEEVFAHDRVLFFWCRGEGAVDELRNERKLAVDDKKRAI